MIKKLQRKIIIVLMTIFSILLIGVLVSINIINVKNNRKESEILITKILENDGNIYFNNVNKKDEMHIGRKFDKDGQEARFRLAQFYSVKLNFEDDITSIVNENTAGYSDEEIKNYAKEILELEKQEGKMGYLLYKVNNTDYGKIIIFIDNSIAYENEKSIFRYSLLFGSIGLAFLFVFSLILANYIVRPVKETFEKQKRFISDASHELKTPLTVIGANADLLESDIGENKWLTYIQSEVLLMSSLVNKLLTLAKIEAMDNKVNHIKVNFSKIVMGAGMPFESISFEKGIELRDEIEEDIFLLGDEYELNQLVGILVDNAIKHTIDKGEIVISLKKIRNKAVLKVMNTGEAISIDKKEKIFERFYRVDESRMRNSKRYGLGLAIAKAIVEKHKGTIDVECLDGWTEFIVTI